MYTTYRGQLPTTPNEEWRLTTRLILIDYFRQCRLPEARLVAEELAEATRGLMSVRGTLVCTAGTVTADGSGDQPVAVAGYTGGILLGHTSLSDLLLAVSDESRATAADRGVMRRVVGGHHSNQPDAVRRGQVAMAAVQDARLKSYRRYEHSILAYLAVAGTEQLLRAFATSQNVNHLRAGGLPDSVTNWVARLALPPALEQKVRTLFDSDQANVRNRLMHSGFLLAASKSFQENLEIANPSRYGPAGRTADPFTPANVAYLTLDCVRELDAEVRARGALTDADLSWAGPWRLTAAELSFGRQIHCDLLPPGNGQAEVRQAVEWANHLSRYFRAVMPGLGQFFRLAYLGFVRPYSPDSFVLLHALGMTFEAVYRLTAQLLGLKVLQESEAGASLRFQYRMLDDGGLSSAAVVGRIVDYLDPADRAVAAEW